MAPNVLSASSLTGNGVRNSDGEDLGKVEDLMIDLRRGQVAYAVLSFGGFLGMGEKLFAIPWSVMKLDTARKHFVLDVSKETLQEAEGFDKDDWPDLSSHEFGVRLHSRFRVTPYWDL